MVTAMVAMTTSMPYLNVWVQGSVNDLSSTKGLCGMFDGMRSNDLMMADGQLYEVPGLLKEKFSNSWR